MPNIPAPPSKHTILASWLFGALLLLFYLGVFTFAPAELPAFKQQMLAIISALLCALFTFFFVGSLQVTVNIKNGWGKLAIQSGGGAAAFVLVLLWWNNPQLAPIKTEQAKPLAINATTVQQTQGAQSPTVINNGGNTTVNYNGMPPEQALNLAKELGVTEAALSNFFNILKQENIAPAEYDKTLRQIAERHLKLIADLANFQSEDPDVKALLNRAEQVLKAGEYDRAESLINQAKDKDLHAAKLLQENVAKRLLSAAEAAAQNGELKMTQIKYREAANYFQEAARIVPPEFAEQLAYYLNQAGVALYRTGNYAEVEALYVRSLSIREQALGKDHPDVATSLNNLALLYQNQGEYAKAEPLYVRSLSISEHALGKDHPDVATNLNNLAELYRDQGGYTKAEPLVVRSLSIREHALGKDHPDVAGSLNNLAELYRIQGEYAKAEPLYVRSLSIFEQALGKGHPRVATSLNNLAELYRIQGEYAKAEPLVVRSLSISEHALGKDHPDVAGSLNNLAVLYRDQGEYAKAEPLHVRSLSIREHALGKDHPRVATSLNNLAELYQAQGEYAKAEPLFVRSLSISEHALGKGHPNVATGLNNLAKLYQAQGEYAKAEPLYVRSLSIFEQALGKDHPSTKKVRNNLQTLQARLKEQAHS